MCFQTTLPPDPCFTLSNKLLPEVLPYPTQVCIVGVWSMTRTFTPNKLPYNRISAHDGCGWYFLCGWIRFGYTADGWGYGNITHQVAQTAIIIILLHHTTALNARLITSADNHAPVRMNLYLYYYV